MKGLSDAWGWMKEIESVTEFGQAVQFGNKMEVNDPN